ncbi:unnamed protein product [Pleuronectes platessa]|uniref:Uncharacterized protein n=1 Tax=Pleuronectes platessa TaxID=8262 RepID=A0A9N7UNR8_PLEPL|nr:unnamed protein product [Pleuronectes platessa]
MSEGLLRRGGAFHQLWTAVPPVITTLNLAGHSSTPLIEHLNLTRCYCWSPEILTSQRIVPDHHGTLAFTRLSHACCKQPYRTHRDTCQRCERERCMGNSK